MSEFDKQSVASLREVWNDYHALGFALCHTGPLDDVNYLETLHKLIAERDRLQDQLAAVRAAVGKWPGESCLCRCWHDTCTCGAEKHEETRDIPLRAVVLDGRCKS